MPSAFRNFAEEKAGPSSGSRMTCPHCSRRFARGGTVSPENEAHEYERARRRRARFAREVDEYAAEGRHTRGEAGFAAGGRARESFAGALARRLYGSRG